MAVFSFLSDLWWAIAINLSVFLFWKENILNLHVFKQRGSLIQIRFYNLVDYFELFMAAWN
jgi:hypothetical protein